MPNQKRILNENTARFILFVLVLVILWQVGKFFNLDESRLREFLTQFPLALSGAIYVVLYIGTSLLLWFGPKDVFRVLGAVIFGPYVSTLFVWIAELGNAAILFHLSRKLGRGFVEEKFKLKAKDIDRVKKDSGWLGVFTLRINPLIPYRFLDLAYGLSKISFRKYFIVAIFSSPLRILWLQIILTAIGSSVIKDPQLIVSHLTEYLYENPLNFLFATGYIVLVFLISIIVGLIKVVKMTNTKN